MIKDLQKFKLASEYAPIHIIFTDTEGTILYANKAVEKLTGYSREEIIGNNPRLWGKQMSKDFYEKFWKVIKEDKKVFSGEIINKRKNGETYIAEARIAPALDDNGNLVGFVGIERDITKEKQIEKAKTEFVSLASHQLKNPLFASSLYTDILLKEKFGKLTPKQKEFLEEIKTSNEKMTDLIKSLLNISRIELGQFINEPQLINLTGTIKDTVKEFLPAIQKKKIVFKEIHPGNTRVLVDPRIINIVLQNLLSNALKYTASLNKITLRVFVNKNNLSIEVSDSGYGIPENQQDKIFTQFFRASNAQRKKSEGTGLGLYLTRSIIEKAGGKIWFESKENRGTTFYVSLPLMK